MKLRVYEMTKNPAARRMLGYLFTRGGVHAHAYALALEKLTGVDMKKMLPIPNIENVQLPEVEPVRGRGPPPQALPLQPRRLQGAGRDLAGRPALDGSGPLEVVDGPPAGWRTSPTTTRASSDAFAPDYQPEEIYEMAQKLYEQAGG